MPCLVILGGFLVGGAAAGVVLARTGRRELPIALALVYAATGAVAGGQVFAVWVEGIDEQITLAVFLALVVLFTVLPPIVAGTAFGFVRVAGKRLAGSAFLAVLLGALAADLVVAVGIGFAGGMAPRGPADSLEAVQRTTMFRRGLEVAAICAAVETAFVISALRLASAVEALRPPAPSRS